MQPRRCLLTAVAATLISVPILGEAESELGYDSAADPFEQVEAARVTAAADGKLILVIAGGDWCIWCHYLHAFLTANPEIGTALEGTFVLVNVYMGEENTNEPFFATLPKAAGYPHFWILASDGTLLKSQNTLPLEDGDKSYDKLDFMAFIDRWRSRH